MSTGKKEKKKNLPAIYFVQQAREMQYNLILDQT